MSKSNQAKFQIGNIVQLNSGSPLMTIKEIIVNPIDNSISYNCQWFDKNTLKDGVFVENTITKYDDSEFEPIITI